MAHGEAPRAAPPGANGDPADHDGDAEEGTPPPSPPHSTYRLWQEVAHGLDKSSTVVWKNAVDSLDQARAFLFTSEEARIFVEKYMKQIISILLEQQPAKIGQMEKDCVEKSLRLSVMIVVDDLESKKTDESGGECVVLEVLSMVFNKKKNYYKGTKASWNANPIGLPEVRVHMINHFRKLNGFAVLADYLSTRVSSKQFPKLEDLHLLLSATLEAIPSHSNNPDQAHKVKAIEDDAIKVSQSVMKFMASASDGALKRLSHDNLGIVRSDLQHIFDRLAASRREATYGFYKFWRDLVLKLITSQSLPLKLFGWEQIGELINASEMMRPPPREYVVSGAGCLFVNGKYDFSGPKTDDGFFRPHGEVIYERVVPDSVPENEGRGKKLTLFRCTMRSQQRWWFLSEADEEQPGTDKDIDYYQHKSKKFEESQPPPAGWVTCRNGVDPSPTLLPVGIMVPRGEEYNTLEHQLAKWAIENDVIELVLGDSIHREIVARSTLLIKFLADMCNRDEPLDENSTATPSDRTPNKFCLQPQHLLLAWKTCTGKADAAVSAEVYQLLVSILPSLPSNLAISLLTAIQRSLGESNEKHDYLFEVAEFCSTLAEADSGSGADLTSSSIHASDEVRAAVLNLLWDVLTHPDASSLKSYDLVKRYVADELMVEPLGGKKREEFLGSCKHALAENANSDAVNEVLSLRIVKLTRFILESCPHEQAVILVTAEESSLAVLLFKELSAYLMRRNASSSSPPLRKLSSVSTADSFHPAALSERLEILRYAYGLSDQAEMTGQQLDHLWSLCVAPGDREALMVFLAKASNSDTSVHGHIADTSINSGSSHGKQPLVAAYSEENRVYAFENLFCAQGVDWEQLGDEAYHSFQLLFQSLGREIRHSLTWRGPAVDALWRICLTAGNDNVASKAMKDLLSVYSVISTLDRQSETPNAWRNDATNTKPTDSTPPPKASSESFSERVFDCLEKVKEGLLAGDVSSERSAERCLRILNAAVGQGNNSVERMASAAATRVASISSIPSTSLESRVEEVLQYVLRDVPHGMRGHSSCRTVAITAKGTVPQNLALASTAQPASNHREEALNAVLATSNGDARQVSQPVRTMQSVRFSLSAHPLETLASIKAKVAAYCGHDVKLVKPISVSSRQANFPGRTSGSEPAPTSLNVVPDDTLVAQLGISDGCEMVFLLANKPLPQGTNMKETSKIKGPDLDFGDIFSGDGSRDAADRFFDTLLAVLESLPVAEQRSEENRSGGRLDTHILVWDLLRAMPTNSGIVDRVCSAVGWAHAQNGMQPAEEVASDGDAMAIDSQQNDDEWPNLLDINSFHRSVYVMQVIDYFLQPAPEILSTLPKEFGAPLRDEMQRNAESFRVGFIKSGGFNAVLRLFINAGTNQKRWRRSRMGNAFALRILKFCFFGNQNTVVTARGKDESLFSFSLDEDGGALLKELSDPAGLLRSLTSMVIDDGGVSDAAILDVLQLLWLLLVSVPQMTSMFASLSDNVAEKFLTTMLLWESSGTVTTVAVYSGSMIRRSTKELTLKISALSEFAFPWLIKALDRIDPALEGTDEFFSVLIKLVESGGSAGLVGTSQLRELANAVCKKLASHPPPTADNALIDYSSSVLCGCLKLLRASIENANDSDLVEGVTLLVKASDVKPWSKRVPSVQLKSCNTTYIDLMGVIFDGFLSAAGNASMTAVCFDKDSRRLGFELVAAAARCCEGGDGYLTVMGRVKEIVAGAAPSLQHRWGQNSTPDGRKASAADAATKYSGLRNQGCTCYMNSVLQQLFMMPGLRKNICSAPLPTTLRSSGSGSASKGADLVGKKISLHWDSGVSYDAVVEGYNQQTEMHTIRYLPVQIATFGGHQGSSTVGVGHHQPQQLPPEEVAALPKELPDEFILSEGRPGKETGAFELVATGLKDRGGGAGTAGEASKERHEAITARSSNGTEETEDQASSRRLLEEVQRTFVHLDEGAKGRCFDPRSLVEASNCLKLEFDVWQQNDASEFAMKLLDRLELSLKKWAPSHFKYLEHTFGLKQTKQKICKECGLKSNREEHLMSIDCQIRGKGDVHEALSTMCEDEIMEGDNKVFCDRCKKKCDTVLRTAISALPDMLILSLKRFDLDFNTFETVKLNSRCAFGETLNMKKYSLEGKEAMEKANAEQTSVDMDVMTDADESDFQGETNDPLSSLPDDDYEYHLAGVLVHAGVAQGGHYYSFIKDRTSAKWYRFDDEDVTPFDPSSIEVECFGGKVKKETKFPNGQVHVSETEQFANALMLFYEKVKPVKLEEKRAEPKQDDGEKRIMDEDEPTDIELELDFSSGYDVFQKDVRRSNTTHSWQSFLFGSEFQSFLMGILGVCQVPSLGDGNEPDRMELSTPISSPVSMSDDVKSSWRFEVLQIAILYLFDILLHTSDKGAIFNWTKKFVDAFNFDKEWAKSFVHDLAQRSQEASSNWLRVYCSECTEEASRSAAVQVISSAIQACASFHGEQNALQNWIQACNCQVEDYFQDVANQRQQPRSMPTKLEGQWRKHEDIHNFDSGSSSSIGVIISALTLLLEVAPRTWRFNASLCVLIRELATTSNDSGGQCLRDAMVEAQFPARLTCLAVRQRSPQSLKIAFPGSSVAHETIEAVAKKETSPSAHLLPLSGSAVAMGNSGMVGAGVNPTIPSHADYQHIFEALGCVLGIKGTKIEHLVHEIDESPRSGRAVVALTSSAQEALCEIFRESKPAALPGMGQREIQSYMRRCRIDLSNISPQKVVNILNKYPTVIAGDGSKERLLSVEGFLAYYCDTAKSHEAQVRSDLHTFGFRPDLSRRPPDARMYVVGSQGERDRTRPYQPTESVAMDVSFEMKDMSKSSLGRLAEAGLLSFHLYNLAYSSCEHLAEYILANCAYGRDTSRLMGESLRTYHRTPAGWGGSEITNACLMIFKVLSSIPDRYQQERLTALMTQSDKTSSSHDNVGIGLLVAGKTSSQHYSKDYHYNNTFERYVDAIKELQHQHAVYQWMSEHHAHWSWLEPWLRPEAAPRHQGGSDFSGRRVVAHHPSVTLNDHHNSDSDMNACMNDSEDDGLDDDDDDDSRYGQIDHGGEKISVNRAGLDAINGSFWRKGSCDGVSWYVRKGVLSGREEEFSLFRCKLSDGSRRWYISIVPSGREPGTNHDVDFYAAPADGKSQLPPENGWMIAKAENDPASHAHLNPPPTVMVNFDQMRNVDEQETDELVIAPNENDDSIDNEGYL